MALTGGMNTPPFPPGLQSHLHQPGTHHPVRSLNRSESPQQIYHHTPQMHEVSIWSYVLALFQFQTADTELGLGLLAVDVYIV